MAEIVITIQKDGKTDIEAIGYQGPSCIMATHPFIVALGAASGSKPKSEMSEEQNQKQENQQ